MHCVNVCVHQWCDALCEYVHHWGDALCECVHQWCEALCECMCLPMVQCIVLIYVFTSGMMRE